MVATSSPLAKARARQALRESGLPYGGTLVKASSTRNEIFLTDRYVVRVNRSFNQRLRRESELYRFLPCGDWTPKLVATGGELGADYLIVQRSPGVPLAHAWPQMSWAQRRRAIGQLAGLLHQIHQVPTPPPDAIPSLAAAPHLLDGATQPPSQRLVDAINQLSKAEHVDQGVTRAALDMIAESGFAIDNYSTSHLIHGDVTFENVLWDGGSISAIVDFEWARGAPADLDLDVVLRCCALPKAHIDPELSQTVAVEDFAAVPSWLANDYPELFSHPHLVDRLKMYSLAFDTAHAISTPVPQHRHSVSSLHPYNRLVALVSDGGYLAESLNTIGLNI